MNEREQLQRELRDSESDRRNLGNVPYTTLRNFNDRQRQIVYLLARIDDIKARIAKLEGENE